MKRSILASLVVAAFLAVTGSASAHTVTVASGNLSCTGATVSWSHFPGGPFDLTATFQDQIGGKSVTSPYVVAHLTGASGTYTFSAPAANGVTFRKLLLTWTADGGGSFTATATVKSCNCKPPTTTTTTTTPTTPGQQTVTTPPVTVTQTTPGPTTTVVKTVTTPGPTTTVTTTVPVAGPVTTVMGPTTTTTITKPGKPTVKTVTRTKIVYRPVPVTLKCPKGYSGAPVYPINKANKLIPGRPILAVCKPLPRGGVDAGGVTG